MDNLSGNSLYKKYGLLLGIFTSIIGIVLLTSLSKLVLVAAVLAEIKVTPYTKFILGIIVRIVAMVFLIYFANGLGILKRIGFGFMNLGMAIKYSAFGYAVAIGFLVDFATVNVGLKNEIDVKAILWCVVFCFMIGLFEETLSRGITMTLIKGTISNKFLVIVIQALIFMLLHVSNYLSGALGLRQLVTQLIIAFVAGLYYGFVYEKTNSLLGAVLLHATYDFCVSTPEFFLPTGEVGIVYSSAGWSILVFAGLFALLFAAIGILVRSIKTMIKLKENFEEEFE